ncbi:MAG: hypothetical protein ACRDL5_17405, partial [Solirubrobacteraceae bacterium]
MKAASLRDEIIAESVALAWDQWSQLGVSGAAPERREERAADPEALLLFTLQVGRNDPRLFDEVLDWMSTNGHLVSIQRLRNLCIDAADTALVNAALASSAPNRQPRAPAGEHFPPQLEPLFPSGPSSGNDLDEAFARYGFARTRITLSGKSQAPRLREPIAFAFRLRRLLGIGVRAEVIRALLTIRTHRLSGRTITGSAAFAQRNVREGLTHLLEAGVIEVVDISDDRQYTIDHTAWAALLGLQGAPDLPFHFDWIETYRALVGIMRWLQQPMIDGLSDYLLASQARTLVEELSSDLQRAGVPVGLYPALGPDFWNEFAEIART